MRERDVSVHAKDGRGRSPHGSVPGDSQAELEGVGVQGHSWIKTTLYSSRRSCAKKPSHLSIVLLCFGLAWSTKELLFSHPLAIILTSVSSPSARQQLDVSFPRSVKCISK